MTYDLTEGIYQEFTFPVSKLLKETLVYIVTSTLQPLSHEKLQVVHTRQETRSTIPLIIHIQCSCLLSLDGDFSDKFNACFNNGFNISIIY